MFSFFFWCVVFRGWHISLYRLLVLLFNTITGLIDFSAARSAQRGHSHATCGAPAPETKLRTLSLGVELVCGVWPFSFFRRWGVSLFTENISVGFVFKWVMGTLWVDSFFWLVLWLIPYIIDTSLFGVFFCYYYFSTPFCPWLEFAQFLSMHILLAHFTCGSNAKWQDRRLWVCMLYFLKCKWFCVTVCECKREPFTAVTGYPPALWLHNVRAGSAQLILVDLVWLEFFLDFRVWFHHWLTLCLCYDWHHPCQHIHVHTKAKTCADSGNSWQTFVG